MLCRATQDSWVMVESSDKMWSTGERNGKRLQYSCLENPMNSMKRQKDRTLKHELPRSVGAQYATGNQWSSRWGYWSRSPFPSPGDLSRSWHRVQILASNTASRFFTVWATREAWHRNISSELCRSILFKWESEKSSQKKKKHCLVSI